MDLHSRRAQPAQSPHRQPPDHPGTHRPASLTRPPAPNPPNSTAPAGDPATARGTTALNRCCCSPPTSDSSAQPSLLFAAGLPATSDSSDEPLLPFPAAACSDAGAATCRRQQKLTNAQAST